MFHEVVQVIKLVKYNRKSHEMISVTCKCIPTAVNKEMHKNEHSHKMMQFRNRIAVWSSLHELALIYRSSHETVFELPVYQIHNEHKSESYPGLLQLVRISPNGSESLKYATVHISHTHTYLNIITHVLKHTPKRTQYVHVLVHVYNNMYTL